MAQNFFPKKFWASPDRLSPFVEDDEPFEDYILGRRPPVPCPTPQSAGRSTEARRKTPPSPSLSGVGLAVRPGGLSTAIARMQQDSEWGGNIEIQAMSLLYRADVIIHLPEGPRMEVPPWMHFMTCWQRCSLVHKSLRQSGAKVCARSCMFCQFEAIVHLAVCCGPGHTPYVSL